ncbi:MAG: DUF4212 domain-containing protein [Planctomycetota bacterium]
MSDPAAVIRRAQQRYWRRNVTLMIFLLALWAFVGLGCGILWADVLNDLGRIGGVPLGFWFAQQGSILTFVVIILVYAIAMNRLDDKYHDEVKDAKAALAPGSDQQTNPAADASTEPADTEGGNA